MSRNSTNNIGTIVSKRESKPWTWGRVAFLKPETEDRFMALACEPLSNPAKELTDDLAIAVGQIQGRKRQTKELKLAVGAIVADLLAAAAEPLHRYSFRPLGKAAFAGQRVGHGPAKDALDGLMNLDLLFNEPGFKCWTNRDLPGQATRYKAKSGLLSLALGYGVTPSNWSAHFRYAPPPGKVANPIIVRGKREYWHKADKGPKQKINKADPLYVAAAAQVDAINAYLARQVIGGCHHHGFRRIFNHGDQQNFAFNMGGRLYAIGGGYQNMKKELRQSITINGEATAELDFRASHLTILYGLAGQTLDPAVDPYAITGFPRAVVKAWIAMTLGYNKFHARWSGETIEGLAEKGIDASTYSIEGVRAAVLNQHPIFLEWPNSKMRWPELQHKESCVIIDSVYKLAFDYDVPSLPVHDSLIVPVSELAVAKRALEDLFTAQVGGTPVLAVKA